MESGNGASQQAQPPPGRRIGAFASGFLWTAIPLVVLNAITSVSALFRLPFGVTTGIAGLLLVPAVVACAVFFALRRRKIAMGILAGIGVGLLSFGLTCFSLRPPV